MKKTLLMILIAAITMLAFVSCGEVIRSSDGSYEQVESNTSDDNANTSTNISDEQPSDSNEEEDKSEEPISDNNTNSSTDKSEEENNNLSTSDDENSSDGIKNESEETEPNDEEVAMVWVSSSGKKYHSKSTCSNMKAPIQISLEEAESRNYEPCKKCY